MARSNERGRLPSERARDIASGFRSGGTFSAWEFHASGDADHSLLYFYNEPLARRGNDGQLATRWPVGSEVVSEPATLRAVLNGILEGLGLRHDYTWSHRGGQPRFYCRIQGRWRDYHVTPGEWVPITHGELARLALHAERRKATITDPAQRMLARMSKFNPGVKP